MRSLMRLLLGLRGPEARGKVSASRLSGTRLAATGNGDVGFPVRHPSTQMHPINTSRMCRSKE
jgi:hypothetical protein